MGCGLSGTLCLNSLRGVVVGGVELFMFFSANT